MSAHGLTLCECASLSRSAHTPTHEKRAPASRAGAMLITGAADTSVTLWSLLQPPTPKGFVQPAPLRALRGHVREITAVAISAELGLAASGAADGCVLLHTTHDGALVRSLAHPQGAAVGAPAFVPHKSLLRLAEAAHASSRMHPPH